MLIRQDSIVYDESGNEYIVEEFIGRGSLGDVYKIQRKSDSKSFALKTVQSPFVDESIIKSIINEGKLSENVKHNNVINYYYFHDGEKYPNLPLYIIMEYANEGTLDDLIDLKKESKEFFTNDELINMFIDLINGMEEINKYLIHRDIKPDNILIKNSVLKISDFGLSKIVTEATRTSTFKGVGCVPYLAPEGWKNYKNTILMDIYSMGFVFYKLACLEHPLKVEENTFQNWQEAHLFQVPISVEKINREVSPVISQLIMRMIEKDTHTRIQNWQEAREFIKKDSQPETNYSDLVKKILLKRREEEQKANEAQLKREKRQKEINEFKKSILFQLKKDIIKPLSEFIDEINNKSDRKKIIFNFNENTLTATIDALPNHIQISLQPIIEENFYREVKTRDYDMVHTHPELRLPKMDNKRILAWGYIKANNQVGMNLILTENENSLYGNWHILINRNSPISPKRRPEPFAFEYTEIEKEIQWIKSTHIYVTTVSKLEIKQIFEFLTKFL